MLRARATVLFVLSVLVASPGWGQSSETSDADTLFASGVMLMKADNCTDAIPKFLRSNELDSSSATLLNLGTCYARLGRKATAWKTYQKAAAVAQSEKNDELRERALQAMAVLGPTLTKVQIIAPRGSAALSLRLNGEELSRYDGLPIPLDPGENVIEAAAPGREPWRRTIEADELGATLVIQVPDLAAIPQARVTNPAPSPSENDARGPLDLRLPAAIFGGVGVVALAVGTAFGVSAKNTYDAANSHCAGNRCTQAGIDQLDAADTKATVSTVAFSAGATALATGIVLWVLSPSRRTSATGGVTPAVGWDGSAWVMAVAVRR